MKKSIQFVVLALMISQAAFAQENLSIGPIAGVSIANFRGDISNQAWKPGPTLGGFINYSANSGFGVSGQVLYTQLGSGNKLGDDVIRLNYIQVPVLLTYFLGKYGQKVRPKLFIGPHINFLLNARNKNGDDINQIDGKSGPSYAYKPIDAGLTAGIGLNVRLADKIWLNTDVRYGLGLVPLGPDGTAKFYNQNIGVNVGVSFPLGKYNPGTGKITNR